MFDPTSLLPALAPALAARILAPSSSSPSSFCGETRFDPEDDPEQDPVGEDGETLGPEPCLLLSACSSSSSRTDVRRSRSTGRCGDRTGNEEGKKRHHVRFHRCP